MDIREALAELESRGGPDDIARYLATQGVKGRVKCVDGCAVARYLEKVTDGFEGRVSPGFPGSRFPGYVDLFPNNGGSVALPEVVNTFANRFDQGNYPELVAE